MTTEQAPGKRTTSLPPGRVPLVVGVTGHRDLVLEPRNPALPSPRAALDRLLRELLAQHPSTPLVVLSGLAEGADVLAADVAFALAEDPALRDGDGGPRIAFIGALPLPEDLFAEDFLDPGHLERVRSIQAKSLRTVRVFDPARVVPAESDPTKRRRAFDAGYARLGAYVSRNCHLLVAFSDGRPKRPDTVGGTPDVIEWFESGAPPEYLDPPPPPNPLRIPDGLACVKIPCERASAEPDPAAALGHAGNAGHAGLPKGDAAFRASADAEHELALLDEFNEDSVRVEAHEIRGSIAGLGAASDTGPIERTYDVADALARTFQTCRRWVIQVLFGLGALALLAFELYAHGPHLFHAQAWVMLLHVAFVAGSVGLVLWARRARIEAKYLVYRSFAEALRVQAAWRELGLPDRADDHYSALHVGSISWVRHGLKGLHVLVDPPALAAPLSDEALRKTGRTWIDEQTAFLESRVHRAHASQRATTLVSTAFLLVGLGLGLTGAFVHLEPLAHGLWLIAMAGALTVSGLLRAWAGQMAYEATIDRYESALGVLQRAARELDPARARGDRQRTLDVLRAVGVEALSENVAWVLLHRDHPLEIRAGG